MLLFMKIKCKIRSNNFHLIRQIKTKKGKFNILVHKNNLNLKRVAQLEWAKTTVRIQKRIQANSKIKKAVNEINFKNFKIATS